MKGAGCIIVVAVTALLVCCSADPRQDQDAIEHVATDRFDGNDHKPRTLESMGGHLVREVRELRHEGPRSYYNFGQLEGRSRYDDYGMRKRNFDEIDLSSLPFPYAAKRFTFYRNRNDADKKRNRPDYPMDEIDLSQFPIGSKRSFDNYPMYYPLH